MAIIKLIPHHASSDITPIIHTFEGKHTADVNVYKVWEECQKRASQLNVEASAILGQFVAYTRGLK